MVHSLVSNTQVKMEKKEKAMAARTLEIPTPAGGSSELLQALAK